jgi:cytochrome P450
VNDATSVSAPSTDIDIYSEEHLLNPFDNYRRLRDLGPLVWFPQYELYGVYRYADVKPYLRDHETFISGAGIGVNDMVNGIMGGQVVIASDPPLHTTLRKNFDDALRPRYLRDVIGDINARADAIVEGILERGEIDGMLDFARGLPVDIVMDLIGFPRDENRKKIYTWASNSFNALGPESQERTIEGFHHQVDMLRYGDEGLLPENLLPGSFGQVAYAAVERGDMEYSYYVTHMLGLLNAGLDTTTNAVGSALWLLATHADQWEILRSDPDRVAPMLFLEAVRLESPAQIMTRVAARPAEIGSTAVPEGARIVHSYGSANRDERHYADPDRFDILRNPVDTLAFDFGIHTCPGRSLSQMESDAMFRALARRATKLELTGEPTREANNVTRGFKTLPIRVS